MSLRRPIIFITFFYISGILSSLVFSFEETFTGSLVFITIFYLLLRLRHIQISSFFYILFFSFFLGNLIVEQTLIKKCKIEDKLLKEIDKEVSILGVIKEIKLKKSGWKIKVFAKYKMKETQWIKVSNEVILYVRKGKLNVGVDENIIFRAKIKLKKRFHNPCDEKILIKDCPYVLVAGIDDGKGIIKLASNGKKTIKNYTFKIKEKIIKEVKNFSPLVSSFILGILIGERGEISYSMQDSFIKTGTLHILSISGLHFGIIVIIMYFIINIILSKFSILIEKIPLERLTSFVTIIFILGYIVFLGFQPPVVRAGIISFLYLFAKVIGRNFDFFSSLFFSMLFILVIEPLSIAGPSFQLSFSSVFAISIACIKFRESIELFISKNCWLAELFDSPYFKKFFSLKKNLLFFLWVKFKRRFLKFIFYGTVVSSAASFALSPITFIHFREIAILSSIINLIIVPLIGFIIVTSIIATILSLLSFENFNFIFEFLLSGFLKFINFLSNFCPSPSTTNPFLLFCQIIPLLLMCYILKKRLIFLISGMFFLILPSIYNFFDSKKIDKDGEIIFFNVGHGDSSFIRLKNEINILIDTGRRQKEEFDAGRRIIIPSILKIGEEKIDYLVISHPHNDHIGGAISVIENLKVKNIVISSHQKDFKEVKDLISFAQKKGTSIIEIKDIFEKQINEKCFMKIFAPSFKTQNLNDLSLVVYFNCNEFTVLWTGDIEYRGEEELFKYKELKNIDILKSPHHGSAKSNSPAFIKKINPKYVIFSATTDSYYPLPSQKVVKNYKNTGADLIFTEIYGAIKIKFQEGKFEIITNNEPEIIEIKRYLKKLKIDL